MGRPKPSGRPHALVPLLQEFLLVADRITLDEVLELGKVGREERWERGRSGERAAQSGEELCEG